MNYFARYALQIEIEQDQKPGNNQKIGGDRMKRLRGEHKGINTEIKKPEDFSRIVFSIYGIKFGSAEEQNLRIEK